MRMIAKKRTVFSIVIAVFVSLLCFSQVSYAVSVDITHPSDGDTFQSDESIWFTGKGDDGEDTLVGDHLVWISSIDGQIGIGTGFEKKLSVGHHRITLVGSGDGEEYAATSIEIDVITPKPTETHEPVTSGAYATYDLGTNIFYIPYSPMPGVSYWINMKVISFLPLRLQITGMGENTYDANTAYASYNVITNTLHVPDYRFEGASYWLDLHMIDAQNEEGYQFELSGADLN